MNRVYLQSKYSRLGLLKYSKYYNCFENTHWFKFLLQSQTVDWDYKNKPADIYTLLDAKDCSVVCAVVKRKKFL